MADVVLELEDLASKLEKVLAIEISRAQLLDILFLIDGSGSITQQQWDIIKSALEQLVDRIPLNESKRLGIIQYSDSTRRELAFSTEKDDVKDKISRMTQYKMGTKTAAGLRACDAMFRESGRNAEQLILLLTDGQSDDNPVEFAKQLKTREKPPTLITIGVGSQVNQTEICAVASSPLHCFTVPSMDNLHEFFTQVAVRAGKKPEVSVDNRRSDRIVLGITCENTVVRKYLIEMLHSNGFRICGEAVVPEQGCKCEFVIQGLQPKTELKLRVTGITQSGLHTLASDMITCSTLAQSKHARILKNGCEQANEAMRKFLKEWRPPKGCGLDYARIALCGHIGSGKSESINELLSAINEIRIKLANSDNSSQSVTRIISEYLRDLGFTATDAWGWQKDLAAYESILPWLLNGILGEGIAEGQDISQYKNGTIKNAIGIPIIGVVLFFPLLSYDNGEELERFTKIRHDIKQLGKPTVTILSKADEVDEALQQNPALIFDSDVVDHAKREFKYKTGIPEEEIFLMTARVNGEDDEEYTAIHDYLIMLPYVTLIKTGIQCVLENRIRNQRTSTVDPAHNNNQPTPSVDPANNNNQPTPPEPAKLTPPASPKPTHSSPKPEAAAVCIFVRLAGSESEWREVNLVAKTWDELTSAIRRIYKISHSKNIAIKKPMPPPIGQVSLTAENVPFLAANTTLEFELE